MLLSVMRVYLSLVFLAITLIQHSYTRIGNLPCLWQSVLLSQGSAKIIKIKDNIETKKETEVISDKKVRAKETNTPDLKENSEKHLKIMKIFNKIIDYHKNQFVPLNNLLNKRS